MIPIPATRFSDARAFETTLPTRTVLSLPLVDAETPRVVNHLLNGERHSVFFLNAHCANLRARRRDYRAALARASHVLPDGIGVDLAARMCGGPLTENLNGTDFTPKLLEAARDRGLSVFLFGGRPGTAERAASRLSMDLPGLRIAGMRDGYEGAVDEADAVSRINASGADIVLVAMGVPKQELWIDRHRSELNAQVVMGVGALFDFLAGSVRRAPLRMRQARLEWLWRLVLEPRRLARRYLLGNATFLARAMSHALSQTHPEMRAKWALDLLGSAAMILALSPLLLIISALIRMDSPGPILFRQVRVGRNGRPFTILKFRSMYRDAEARLAEVRAHSDREGVCFKARRDPRITPIGRLLRRTSLDELPQLFNVLYGQMSLVGPRPALPSEVAIYPDGARERLAVRPGITGLWQVAGRADIRFDKMVDMDLAYVRSRSFLVDMLILVMTARAVVSGRGAY